jgi:DNA processing protein
MQLEFNTNEFAAKAVSPFLELGAYETLWEKQSASFKSIAELFAKRVGDLPSDLVERSIAVENANLVHAELRKSGVADYGVRIHGMLDYPTRLRLADYPVEFLYFQGWWELINSPKSIAIVGTRNPTQDGLSRARKIVRNLLDQSYTIVSGLARGIDTAAHEAAIAQGGRTIAVLGTPLSKSYPTSNSGLQKEIATKHLVISQVPVKRYLNQRNPVANNFFFPERNITMSALTDATVIVEAGETSGTLVQARHALKQGKKLFILENNFRNNALNWPRKFEEKGAIRVSSFDDIQEHLKSDAIH